MKSIQEQADELVEKFKDVSIELWEQDYGSDGMYVVRPITENSATQCAIIHVEGTLVELRNTGHSSADNQIAIYDLILTELKSRL